MYMYYYKKHYFTSSDYIIQAKHTHTDDDKQELEIMRTQTFLFNLGLRNWVLKVTFSNIEVQNQHDNKNKDIKKDKHH